MDRRCVYGGILGSQESIHSGLLPGREGVDCDGYLSLLNQDGRNWDFHKLSQIFNQADVEAISNIKLPQRSTEDILAWHMEKNGMFSVRSAYNLVMKLEHVQKGQTSSLVPSGERKLWS